MVSGAAAQAHEDRPVSLGPAPYPVSKYMFFLSLSALSVLAEQIRDVVSTPSFQSAVGKREGLLLPGDPLDTALRLHPCPWRSPLRAGTECHPAVCPQHLVSSKAGSTGSQSSGLSMAILSLSEGLQTQRHHMQTTAVEANLEKSSGVNTE